MPPGSETVHLQTRVDRALLSIEGTGNFAYKPRWYWKEGARVSPCEPLSPLYLEAEQLLSNVDSDIKSAASEALLESLRVEIESLAAHPCFATVASVPYFRSVNSLQDFWSRGGRLAFTMALNVKINRSYVLQADPRPSIHEFVAEHRGLARFVCRSTVDCTLENRWKELLQEELIFTALRVRLERLTSGSTGWEATPERCALAAATAPRDLQFVHWRECAERIFPDRHLLPRGNFRAIKTGWLFLYVEHPSQDHSGYFAINLATGGTLRVPYGFVCTPGSSESGEAVVSCATGFATPVRMVLGIQDAQHLLWNLLMQTGVATGRSHSSIIRIPPDVAATGIAVPTLGHCLGSGRSEVIIAWALANQAGALIATGVDDSMSGSLLARTQVLHDAMLAAAPPPEALREGQSQWWPQTSKLLAMPWNALANSGLFEALKEVENDSWDVRKTLIRQ